LLEELRVRHINLDNQALTRGVKVQPFNRIERRRVQQTFGGLARLFDVLV
jgi:hypothetical protein